LGPVVVSAPTGSAAGLPLSLLLFGVRAGGGQHVLL